MEVGTWKGRGRGMECGEERWSVEEGKGRGKGGTYTSQPFPSEHNVVSVVAVWCCCY